MRVDPQSASAETLRATAAAGDRVKRSSFAASLAKASESTAAGASASARRAVASAAEASASGARAESAAFTIPKSERYQAVPGKPYEEIVAGPRNGMFINRSGNSRDGDAFVLVKRGGRQFHIYGKGDRREVVPVPVARDSEKPAAAEKVADVPGRAFDRITEGDRQGMYVNRSGNARDGQAFRLVERGERELHIYGSGRNRLVVSILAPEHRRERDEAEKVAVKPADAAIPAAGGQV